MRKGLQLRNLIIHIFSRYLVKGLYPLEIILVSPSPSAALTVDVITVLRCEFVLLSECRFHPRLV